MKIFSAIPQILSLPSSVTSFYARTPIYYYTLLPTYLDHEVNTREFQHATNDFFLAISRLPPDRIHYDYIAFASEIFKFIKSFQPMPDELGQIFAILLRHAWISPSLFLCHFFFPWYYFVQKCHDTKNPMNFADQIELVTRLIEASALLKYHECHRQFSWYLCFYFYDFVQSETHQERILSFVCAGIRRVVRMEVFTCIGEAMHRFSNHRLMRFSDRPWPIYYMWMSLDGSLGTLILDLRRIVGAGRLGKVQSKLFEEKITFSAQGNSNNPLDSELYTMFPMRMYDSVDELLQSFEKFAQLADSVRRRFSSAACFQFQFAVKLAKIRESEQKSNESLCVLQHYVNGMFRYWTELMILVAHRQTLLMSYSQPEVIESPRLPPSLVTAINSPKRLLEMTSIFRRFWEVVLTFPVDCRPLFAREIVAQMFEGIKREELTFAFIQYFQWVTGDFTANEYHQSLLSNI
jgi:hypothetical protein